MDALLLDEDGLFPSTPFFWDPSAIRARFRLYPEPFVERLAEICEVGYLGHRLDRDDWARFHHDVCRAYEQTVTPLLSRRCDSRQAL